MSRHRPSATKVALWLLALAGALSVQLAGAASQSCVVLNTSTNVSSATLQAAIDGATAGSTLEMRGTCSGAVIMTKNLTITGATDPILGGPTWDGSGDAVTGDFSWTIGSGTTVTLAALTIIHGDDVVYNAGTLTLDNTTVAQSWRAIYNVGTLTLSGHSSVEHNSSLAGGGIYNAGTLRLNGSSSVHDNDAGGGGGGGIANSGDLTLEGSSSVVNNQADAAGGIWNMAGGRLKLNGQSTVSGNHAVFSGGGISNFGALTMNGWSSVVSNTVSLYYGGGIVNGTTGTVTLHGPHVSISGNSPDDRYGF